MRGKGGGQCGVSANKYSCAHEAQINPIFNLWCMCRYTGHKDGVWDVAVSRLGLPVVGTVSADHTAKVSIAETDILYRLASPLVRAPCLLLIRGRIRRKTWWMGPYAGVDYNLTLCPLQRRLQHIYHGQPYARVYLNPIPESTLTLCQSRP